MNTMKRKMVCKKQVSMEQEQGGREGEGAKWVTHYSSDHQILLVGEGDFSFSFSLAQSFGSAANIVASSLDSYDDLKKKYKKAKSNLDGLQKLGACLLHGVDATEMKLHSDLKMRRFDRVIFNFPHAGFHGKEDDLAMIKMHKDLVLGFFKNANQMLTANGEIHVNHKTSAPFNKWDIEELAMQSFLTLIDRPDFHKEDYPGYNNKRGDSYRCDEPFPLGKCSTFKFIHNPRPVGKARRRQRKSPAATTTTSVDLNCYPQPTHPSKGKARRRRRKSPATTTTTSVDLNCYPQPTHPSKFNDTVASLFGLPNGYTPNTISHLLNNVEHRRDAPCAGYSSNHGMNPGSQRLLQPMQPLKPMESLNSFQPWPTSTNVSHSQTNHVRTMDTVPLSHGTRNEVCQIFRGTSNYLQEERGGTSQSAPGGTSLRSYDRAMPEFKSHNSQLHSRATVHSELPRMMEDRTTFVALPHHQPSTHSHHLLLFLLLFFFRVFPPLLVSSLSS